MIGKTRVIALSRHVTAAKVALSRAIYEQHNYRSIIGAGAFYSCIQDSYEPRAA